MKKGFTKSVLVNTLAVAALILAVSLNIGCGPTAQKVETEPTAPPAPEPTIEELRKPVAKDPTIYKVTEVIKNYGRQTQKYMAYERYQKVAGGALDPNWFCDNYKLELNEKGHWMSVIFATAQRAIDRDPRIEKLMADLPPKSITVNLQAPSGRKYLLNDADADGVLDFVKDKRQKEAPQKVDIQLLDRMQEKYTWILGLIKKHYKKK